MIYDGNKTVAAAGTAEALMSSRTPASWVTVQALLTNTSSVYVGASTVDSGRGIELPSALDSWSIPELGGPTYLDLSTIYVDAAVNGEGVKFIYGRR